MKKSISYSITTTEQGLTAGQFLRKKGYSAGLMRRLKAFESGLLIDGLPAYTIHPLKDGEILTVNLPEEPLSPSILPIHMDLDIIYEDEDLIVVNKGAGVPIHPSQGNHDNSLANGIAWHLLQHQELCAYHAINRLDKDTTGLLILAKHSLSACLLSGMVIDRTLSRYYVAIASGLLPERGFIDAPIARANDSTIERCVDFDRGRDARTHYRRLYYDKTTDCSLAAVKLDTGRTHQIRVHFQYIGHPLPGDFLYNPDYRLIGRQALHSCRLEFLHPLKKEPLVFTVPLPDDMKFMEITSIEGLWDNDF